MAGISEDGNDPLVRLQLPEVGLEVILFEVSDGVVVDVYLSECWIVPHAVEV